MAGKTAITKKKNTSAKKTRKSPATAKKSPAKGKSRPAPAKKKATSAAGKKLNGHGSAAVKTAAPTVAVKLKVRKSGRKPAINIPAPPPVEVSNLPKAKVKSILVSQPAPTDPARNPWQDLTRKYNLHVSFRHFIKVEGLNAQEFRAQRIDILAHGAVILTSKLAVDHYFRICQEMRITVPESMKYFCINEQTAYYLQKYIQYRKRKIFFGHGTILDLVDVIRKNKSEKFLLPVSDVHKEQIVDILEEVKISFTKAIFYKTVSADLGDMKSLSEFDIIVFFTPAGIKSLRQNFPDFKQGGTRIAAFGYSTAQTIKQCGYRLDIFAPNPQNPSMTGALDAYIREANKR